MDKIQDKLDELLPADPPPEGNVLARALDRLARFFRHIQRQPVHVQIATGGAVGFTTSYFCTRLSKFCALVAGCSFVLIQFLNYRGYLKFDRGRLQRDLDGLGARLKGQIGGQTAFPSNREVDDFLGQNGYLFSGFIGGSLVGYGLA
ncbi:FUN14 domain-containing protein 1-like isoform X1 [Aphelenchoides fujianensis]|nr:FUN14 domain-containing protein 1-like isoform X1 [Aphelenchoides fujianensis]